MLNNLKINNSVSTFQFNGKTIEVLNYLDIRSYRDLIDITIQKAEEDGIYNQVLLNAYLSVCAAYLFTNVDFTDEEKADSLTTYDILKSNGFIDKMIETIGDEKWAEIEANLYAVVYARNKQKNSIANIVNGLINNLPQNAAKAEEIMKDFDVNKFQQIMNFVNAANGNGTFENDENITPIK